MRLSTLNLVALVIVAQSPAQSFKVGSAATFVDLSVTGGTAIAHASHDSEHNIVTTIGNSLFPAGDVRISNSGVVIAGLTAGDVDHVNAAIAATGVPSGLPSGGTAYLLPFWDDLDAPTSAAGSTIWWKEDFVDGILTIMWSHESHFSAVAMHDVTFEVQIVNAGGSICAPPIVFLYADTAFGGTLSPFDGGASATVGYVNGSLPGVSNVQYSFNCASLGSVTSLEIVPPPDPQLWISSPSGSGALMITMIGFCGASSYLLVATTHAGGFPAGWLFGIDVPVTELLTEFDSGAPFYDSLSVYGERTVGPYYGLPPITVYLVAMGFTDSASFVPAMHSAPYSYTIP